MFAAASIKKITILLMTCTKRSGIQLQYDNPHSQWIIMDSSMNYWRRILLSKIREKGWENEILSRDSESRWRLL
ncbi:hypothetical protein DERP_000335 [Dermatophagoides pteronyssinus]|uniref:Uncharacterized protein n=1 Tax=Dermatophagoides pteronyssinus TaxID=6956 RepID=A0ABQ8J086_DERPT|nr:hypothetical protein DERP_000335 [Dermatophagoides pteronyssinus]